VNIHPALLPNYGGKGMFGMHVHEAVVKNREAESGITIHYVNELYDAGSIIFQAKVNLSPDETAESLAAKIHLLEQKHFPTVVERVLNHLP
jgi:phosphoribosylglycinamide formyltransferase-1